MKRIIVALVLIIFFVTTVGLLTLFTFAVPQNGDQSTTDYVDTLIGSDGAYYIRNGVQSSIKYYADGSTGAFIHENYDGPRQHYLIMPDGDDAYYGYCIEQGESFPDAQRYSGVGWTNDSYFSKLPKTVQTGIMLATIFGWQPGKTVPVANCNEDDWYWATQVIIWEYQQKLRTSPTEIQGNGYVSSNYFQSTLAGRPAEKCYNDMLASMANYQVIPSFTSAEASSVPLNILKWDSLKQQWNVTLNDNNHIGYPLISDDSMLKIQRNGNQYTFSSTTELDINTIQFRRDISLPSHEMLIWGGANTTQAISTGAADPIYFYAQFRTEQQGTIELVKISEDDKIKDIQFTLQDNHGQFTELSTDEDGVIRAQLYPGVYLVSEELSAKYRIPDAITIEVKENEITRFEIANILKKGQVRIQKNVLDTISSKTIAEKGAVFQIYSDEYPTYDATPKHLRDEITTNDQGIATSQELPMGNYIAHQTVAGKNITISQEIPLVIENDLQTVALVIENQFQKGKIQILKKDNAERPLAGGIFILKTAEDILQPDGTIRICKGCLIDTLRTDDVGFASSDWLYPGKYDLVEIKAPEGYVVPKNPVTTVMLNTENQTAVTFFTQVKIGNDRIEEFPYTGDKIRNINVRIMIILLLMSLIGIGVLSYMMVEEKKTLH